MIPLSPLIDRTDRTAMRKSKDLYYSMPTSVTPYSCNRRFLASERRRTHGVVTRNRNPHSKIVSYSLQKKNLRILRAEKSELKKERRVNNRKPFLRLSNKYEAFLPFPIVHNCNKKGNSNKVYKKFFTLEGFLQSTRVRLSRWFVPVEDSCPVEG